MNLKELVDIYENIDTVSVKELYSAFVMYCKIVYRKHGDYDLEDIKNYCKYVYLLKQSEKLKNELSKLTSYGRNEQLLPALDVVNDIYKSSALEVDRLAVAIDCYDHKIEPVKDGLEDLFLPENY